MRVNFGLLALYAFCLVIMYLAGVYFGDILQLLFVFFCLYPVFSLISLVIWYAGLDFEQSFSTLMPVKGEKVGYRLMIFNRSFLPLPSVRMEFANVSPSMDLELPPYSASISAGRVHDRTFEIHCPYRGEYTIGVKSLEVHDFFRLFSIKKTVKPERFSVFPRIIVLDTFSPVATAIEGSGKNASAGIMPDPTLFQQLREYREGDSVRHIYWKKYASTGRPILKEYERTKKSGVRIYFDTRRHRWRGVNPLEQEDVSVETLVALVRYLLENRVHTSIIAPGWKGGMFASQDPEFFDEFYRATLDLKFSDNPSPATAYHEDRSTGDLESQTVIFITHIIDAEIFAIRENAQEHELHFIMNSSGYMERDQKDIAGIVGAVREFGAEALCVRSEESIREDLGDRVAGAN